MNRTPLFVAVADEGHVSIIKMLLEKGADPNVVDKFGLNLLQSAASNEILERGTIARVDEPIEMPRQTNRESNVGAFYLDQLRNLQAEKIKIETARLRRRTAFEAQRTAYEAEKNQARNSIHLPKSNRECF